MVRDGYYYALASLVAAGLIVWLASPPWAGIPLAFGAFCAWFFRDPERQIPAVEGAIVSPGDGRVTDIVGVERDGRPRTRISIFLSVFDVHVNRSPIGGVIRGAEYRKGLFKNALGAASADCNEQNIVTVDDGRQAVVFKQIAGLIARRIVFTKRVGDAVARGERIGMIKFGSRCDVVFDAAASVQVRVGQHVAGGSSILALAPVSAPASPEREPRNAEREKGVLR
ncbi:MAG: phosphatidylserine decarboxylase [Acidobacteriia bacterium]|nr:phosphatidylserine decarboxylase [Terriglobia bacterium]